LLHAPTLPLSHLARGAGFVDVAPTNLQALTEGIHSREALELVGAVYACDAC
jgi:hypothetical protein